MERIPNQISFTTSREVCTMMASVQGAGAAVPVIPTTVLSKTSSIQPMLAEDNFASGVAGDITRAGVGLYGIKLKDGLPVILDIVPNVWGTDGKQAQMTDYNPSTRIASMKVYTAAGVAADLAATDNLRLTIVGRLNP